MRKNLPLCIIAYLCALQLTFGQVPKPSHELTEAEKTSKELHEKMESIAKERFPSRFEKSIDNPPRSIKADSGIASSNSSAITEGFAGPYLMQQLDTLPPETTAGAFGGGFIFPTSEVFIINEGEGRRSFNTEYIDFNSFRDYFFAVTDDGTIFEGVQPTGWQCTLGISLGTADDSLGTIDAASDSIFYLRIKDNVLLDCGGIAQDAEFIFVRQADRLDLAVIDISEPNGVFLGEEINPQVFVSNFGNNIQDGFDLSYSVDGTQVATQYFDESLLPGQGVLVTFDTPFDFSVAGDYTIEVTVSIDDDADSSNDSYSEDIQSYEPISSFPYVEDFEEGVVPVGYEGIWQIASGATSPARSGPSGDNTNGDGFYMVGTTDGNVFSTSILDIRAMDLSSLESPALTFYYHMFGTQTASMSVNVTGENGFPLELFSIEGEQQDNANSNYKAARVDLSRFADQQVVIQFAISSSGQIPSDIAIDDIEVSEGLTHDLSLTDVRAPFNVVSGMEGFSVVVYNPGESAEAGFDISAYVNGDLVATETYEDVLLSGNSGLFEFDATYDFSASGVYELLFEVDLPADEFEDNNTIRSTSINDVPWTGIYQLEQSAVTTEGPSAGFNNGIVFGTGLINTVTLEYVDETTRSMHLAYLEPFGTALSPFTISFANDELIFVADQDGGIGCGTNIILSSSEQRGFYDGDDIFGEFFVLEDVQSSCGAGTPDVLFSLSKKIESDLQITSINLADVIPTAEHFINFTVLNPGVYEQRVFNATFSVDNVPIATEEFFTSIASEQSRSFSFEIPHGFLDIAEYTVKVEISGGDDEDATNNSLIKLVQTSGYVINATPISDGRIGIEWNDLRSATSYVLQRVEEGEFVDIATLGSDANFYIDEDLIDTVATYEYRLEATLSDGSVSYSDVATASPSIEGTYQFEKVLGDITGVDLPNWTYGNSWADLDNDGDLDMVVSNVPNFDGTLFLQDVPYVYLNDGTGKFEKILDNNLVAQGTSTRSTAIIDFDNDGLQDVFMPQLNSSTNDLDDRLFRNNGSLDFQRVEFEGLNKNHSNEQSVWGDMDNDGDLDLLIAGSFGAFKPNFLFVNNGDGTFESVTEGAIYEELFDSRVFAWTATWVDFDNDGDQDLYVPSNVTEGFDGAGARMFRNIGAGEFEVVTNNILVDDIYSVRGAHWADVDQDGLMDLILIPVNSSPVFYFNDGEENFTKVESSNVFGESLNIHRISTIGDLDNNGKQELIFSSNGLFVYESNNDRTFTRVDDVFPPIMGGIFAGMSLADMDGDGDLDLFRGNGGSGYAHNVLYENKGNSNNWLHVNLTGEFSNANGIGAKVVVYTEDDAQYRTINPISGLISQGSLLAEFGLGSATVVDSVKIYWPSGTVKELYAVAVNQVIEVDDSNAPTDVGVSNSTIPEGLDGGAPVGAGFSVDLDGQEDGHTYDIIGGSAGSGGDVGGGFNIYTTRAGSFGDDKYSPVSYSKEDVGYASEILASADADNFFIENGTIKAAASFDFESQSSYSIQVRTTDSFGNTFDKVLEIEILDVNEEVENNAPSDISLSSRSIEENQSIGTVLGTLASTDLDEDNTHTYSLVDGDANTFSIDGDQLLVSESFNFERNDEYTLTIRSIDNFGKSIDKEFTIKVENVNEVPLELELDSEEVEEEQVPGTLIGNLSTEDTDNNDTHTYTVSGEDTAFFQIVGNELLTAQRLDFEEEDELEITITSTDAGGLAISEDYTIIVNDINDAPSAVSLSNSNIEENLVEGLLIGNTTDDDVEDNHTYALSGSDAGSFQIVLDELRTGAEFNFEERSSYDIEVITTDVDGLSYGEEFTVTILDQNEAPSEISLSTSDVVEEQPAGLLVGALSVSDEDFNDTHTFTLVSGDGDSDNARFILLEEKIYTSEILDFETVGASLEIRVRAEDQDGGAIDVNFNLTVVDVDESVPNTAPSAIDLSSFEVEENSGEESLVGTLSSTDADAGDTHTYTLVDGDIDFFYIDGAELKAVDSFDFEERSSYDITVRTTDDGGLIFDEDFTVSITDVNEAPNSLSLSSSQIDENVEIGTVVAALTTDDDDSGDTHTYTIDGSSSFDIDGNNLVTAEELDFEGAQSFSFNVISIDADGLTVLRPVTIEVLDLNEAPTTLAIDNSSVPESLQKGLGVGVLSVSDEDAGDSHTYELSGDDAASFVVVIDELRTVDELDFESKSTYSVTVTATDAQGLSTSSALDIAVTDVNEAPTALALSATSLDENTGVGSVLADILVTDEDVDDTHTYALSGADASSFGITDSNELEILVAADFEVKSQFALTLTGTDSGGETVSEDFIISINDINEAPSNVLLSGSTIVEGEAANTMIGVISFDDFDIGDSHTITVGGADAALFVVEDSELKNVEVIDFETTPTASITISVEDAGGLETVIDVTVAVSDINEAPTALLLSNVSISENEEEGAILGDISIIDEDVNDTHSYALSGVDAANFRISESNQIEVLTAFDFEVKSQFELTITGTDSGGESISEDFSIIVSDVNESPTAVLLSSTSINENLGAGTLLAEISIIDEDIDDTHVYALAGTDASSFRITDSNQIEVLAPFNFEVKSEYEFTITGTDSGGESISNDFLIEVVDLNEAPTAIALDGASIDEGVEAGSSIGLISVTDEDANETFTYSIIGDGAANFEVANNELVTATVLDFDDAATYALTIEATDNGGLTVSAEFVIEVQQVLGLGDFDDSLLIYPNPSDGIFTIELDQSWQQLEWSLYDLNGRRMAVTSDGDIRSGKLMVDATNLNQGEYILMISNGEERISRTILINK